MTVEFEPIKNQKFDIGRTINPFKCDCTECTFMNCPKKNYAVKMKIKKHSVDDFFNTYTEQILKLNRYKKIEPVDLRLSYFLINELVGDCISFSKGTYWGLGECIDSKKEIEDSIYNSVKIQSVRRDDNIVTHGVIYISDGRIVDYNLNDSQYKTATRISAAFKKVRELTDKTFEKRDTSCIGWIDRNGRLYKCDAGQHEALARKLGSSELMLECQGWVKIFYDYDKSLGFYCTARKSPEQINRLIELGYMDNE